LAAFGELFTKRVIMCIYPSMQEGSEELMTCQNIPIPERIKYLYRHLLENHKIVDIENYNKENLHIFSKQVLNKIKNNEPDWQDMVPTKVADLIKEKYLFDFPFQTMKFEY